MELLFSEPLEGDELTECEERGRLEPDDPCTDEEKNGEMSAENAVDSLLLMLFNVQLCMSLCVGWKLYQHPTSNSEMRRIPI